MCDKLNCELCVFVHASEWETMCRGVLCVEFAVGCCVDLANSAAEDPCYCVGEVSLVLQCC